MEKTKNLSTREWADQLGCVHSTACHTGAERSEAELRVTHTQFSKIKRRVGKAESRQVNVV